MQNLTEINGGGLLAYLAIGIVKNKAKILSIFYTIVLMLFTSACNFAFEEKTPIHVIIPNIENGYSKFESVESFDKFMRQFDIEGTLEYVENVLEESGFRSLSRFANDLSLDPIRGKGTTGTVRSFNADEDPAEMV
jgi:hypothetical protein